MIQDRGSVARSCEHGNEASSFIRVKGGEFLDQLSDCGLRQRDRAL